MKYRKPKNDGLFKSHLIRINLPTNADVIYLHPFGDVHHGAHNHNAEKWGKFCKERGKDGKNHYYLGMGDYNEFASWTDKRKIKTAGLRDGAFDVVESGAMRGLDEFMNTIHNWGGTFIGLLQGNHDWEFADMETGTQKLASELHCEYLGGISYVRLVLHRNRGFKMAVDIVATHGKGGSGKLLGTSINKVDDLKQIFPDADIYLMGHDHKSGALPTQTLKMSSRMNLVEKRQWCARTGGFLAGYLDGDSTYISSALLRPTALGTLKFKIAINKTTQNGKDVFKKTIEVIQ